MLIFIIKLVQNEIKKINVWNIESGVKIMNIIKYKKNKTKP